ncbi:MAG: hypothetical protein AVDCRST_MAG42-2734 [uncultured Chthoniobacterales bacterium]|uniref:Uncharacterized protein n=1 Tax=uncultured Chthoniobacterales bacterium TaxID=1836801 RepID=A0A6J4IP53_9BACT|nr:MAG: hypothetical protein AVDCRST_MAG42-2734 [uncultured Chthoniobacterales bacterium]
MICPTSFAEEARDSQARWVDRARCFQRRVGKIAGLRVLTRPQSRAAPANSSHRRCEDPRLRGRVVQLAPSTAPPRGRAPRVLAAPARGRSVPLSAATASSASARQRQNRGSGRSGRPRCAAPAGQLPRLRSSDCGSWGMLRQRNRALRVRGARARHALSHAVILSEAERRRRIPWRDFTLMPRDSSAALEMTAEKCITRACESAAQRRTFKWPVQRRFPSIAPCTG